MKIEICEQMVQSWLINCKNCQVAQTNWFISPLKDIDSHKKDISDYIDYFVNALKKGVSSGKLDSDVWNPTEEDASELHKLLCEDGEEVSFMEFFHMMVTESEAAKDQKGNVDFSKISILGRAGKAKELQFVKQTEIDILGVELDNGQAKNIYIIDTAFHKAGLNYSDTVSSVTKKIIRAVLVADIIFGTNIPVHIVFASPVCKSGPEGKIQAVKKYIEPLIEKRPTLHGATSLVNVEVYLNQAFAERIYLPLRREIDKLNNDNDLFMRAMNLAKAAEENLPESEKSVPSSGKKSGYSKKRSGGKSGGTGAAKAPAASTSDRRRYTDDDKYKEAAYYLRKVAKLTEVEEVCLGVNNSGSTAKGHLNQLGIDTSDNSPHKGMLSKIDIDDAITNATNAKLKHTLEEIKAQGLHLKP